GRKPRANAGCTCWCASIDGGRSPRCGARRWRSRARSSDAYRRSRHPSGGRRSGAGFSSTTTRTPRTARSRARIRSGPRRTLASPRPSTGAKSPMSSRRPSRSRRCPRASLRSVTAIAVSTSARTRWRACSNCRGATRKRVRAMRPGRRNTPSSQVSRRASSLRSGQARRAKGLRQARRPPAAASRLDGPENLLQRVRRRDLELIVAAVLRRLVETPAQEVRRVAEAIALQVVVLHLADTLGAQRLPRQVLISGPAADASRHASRFVRALIRPFAPGMIVERVVAQRGKLLYEALAHRHRERGCDADVMQRAAVVVQTQEQ